MMRVPEPLERVRAMVCEPCWVSCFDTDGFEELGRRDIEEFEYEVTKEDLQGGNDTGCPWCLLLYSKIKPDRKPDKLYTISLSANSGNTFTPSGSNLYDIFYESDSDGFCFLLYLSLYTEADNLAAHHVTARKVDTDFSPSNTSTQMLEWLKECALHQCCPKNLDAPLPTRVIEVVTPKILLTDGAVGKYAALSYCWGTGSHIQLRSHTLRALTQNIELNDLPQTIKDAILVTRSLSIPYLWVDALCIIQYDQEDKAREIGSMAQIYSKAYVTILASNAADAAHGFLERRPSNESHAMRIPFRISPNRFGSVTARELIFSVPSDRQSNPLGQRAWALQKQMMANRLLLYTPATLEWRCAAGMKSLHQSLNVVLEGDPMPKLVSQLGANQKEALEGWVRVVKDYSRRAMSVPSDRLPAIAALAEKFAPVLGQYYAGIWQYAFITQLDWRVAYSLDGHSDVYRAPSWSWASTDGQISWCYQGKEEICCELVSVESVPKSKQIPYGEVD